MTEQRSSVASPSTDSRLPQAAAACSRHPVRRAAQPAGGPAPCRRPWDWLHRSNGPPTANPGSAPSGQGLTKRAPEIEGIAAWINSEPLSLSDLRGRVVVLDFWTYTCVNCVRTIPVLDDWRRRYSDDGLSIIGIHTPEFEFEKDPANVTQAAGSLGVTWPVALDNDYVTWDNYQNAFWPTKYLIDARGRVRHYRIGEGGYARFEEEIRALLLEAGSDLTDDPPAAVADHVEDTGFVESPDREITRELYAGYDRGDFEREYYGRGFVDQQEYYAVPGQVLDLQAPEALSPGFLYFHGAWRVEGQQAVHARQTEGYEDHVALVYSARAVNAVLSTESGEPIRVRVQMDGEYLTAENKGADVVIGPDGESFLVVDRSRMYRVVENPAYLQRRNLRLSVNADQLGVYAFTFGIYDTGP